MEERSGSTHHRLILTNREEMSIVGVSDVISFDESSILVETELGTLEIRGQELHVNQLNLESGEMSLTGEIEGIEYEDKALYKKGNKTLLNRLFG